MQSNNINQHRTNFFLLSNGSGNSPEFRRVLGWFWAAVSNFSQTEMARLLQFTTGCSQLPPGGFQVRRSYVGKLNLNLWNIPFLGIESTLSDNSRANLWQFTDCAHMLQSTLSARLRELRALRESSSASHQRRNRRLWNGLNQFKYVANNGNNIPKPNLWTLHTW